MCRRWTGWVHWTRAEDGQNDTWIVLLGMAHLCSLTTMRSCVGSIVRSAMEKVSLCALVGIIGVSRSGSSALGRGMRRIDTGYM